MSNVLFFAVDNIVGSISAISTIPFIQPFLFWKNHSQQKVTTQKTTELIKNFNLLKKKTAKPFIKDPRILYRGTTGFAISFIPKIGLQTATKGALNSYLDGISAGIVAGAISTIIVSPTEMVLVQQQNYGKNYYHTIKKIYQTAGIRAFTRGGFSTALREGGIAGGFLGFVPVMKRKMMEKKYSELSSQIWAGLVGGIVTSTITHPADTFKTRIQSNLFLRSSLIHMYCIRLGWRGYIPRLIVNTINAITIPLAQENLNKTSVMTSFKNSRK